MKQERLFKAIGGADPLLLARSQHTAEARRRRRAHLRWGLAAAACLAVVSALLLLPRDGAPPAPPAKEDPAPRSLRLDGGDTGTLHLLALSYGGAEAQQAAPDFLLYVNREIYRSYEKDGRYVVEPLAQAEGLPPCRLEIEHLADTSPAAAAEAEQALLEASYAAVTPAAKAAQAEALLLRGDDGTAWDARQADVYLVDDRMGGVFRITAQYFTEAAEGHGVRFADMVGTFEVVTPEDAAPAWLRQLEEAARRLAPALFSGRLDGVGDLLAPEARMDAYGEDVTADLSVAAMDCAVDDDRAPSSAVISVRHRLGTEDSFSYLTIELIYQEGRWLAQWSGIEK